jgi:tetratricopeptide (TPR) repeat protein
VTPSRGGGSEAELGEGIGESGPFDMTPEDLDEAFRLGALLVGSYQERDPERAIPLLEGVVAAVQGYHPAYYYLGEALVMCGKFDAAETVWRRALALDPEQETIRWVLANLPIDRVRAAVASGGDVIAAVERISPDERTAEVWLHYGDALALRGRNEEAARAWREAMTREPLRGMRRRFQSIGFPFPRDEDVARPDEGAPQGGPGPPSA